MFGIDPEQREKRRKPRGQPSAWRTAPRSCDSIKGWGYDSNSPEGAVLKGWVESRFGICRPTTRRSWTGFRRPVDRLCGGEDVEPLPQQRHRVQLDLLFEFCQWAIERFSFPGQTHATLYRGVNAFDEHRIVERTDKRNVVIRLNNLVSFTSDRNVATCFGDTILTARVPLCKILFFNGLMSTHPLKGEGEYLAIGGEYRVTAEYY